MSPEEEIKQLKAQLEEARTQHAMDVSFNAELMKNGKLSRSDRFIGKYLLPVVYENARPLYFPARLFPAMELDYCGIILEEQVFPIGLSTSLRTITDGISDDVDDRKPLPGNGYSRVEMAAKHLPYDRFLLTPYWRIIANKVLEQKGRKCVVCTATSNLEVHHTTYEHRGREIEFWREDLVPICAKHHGMISVKESEDGARFRKRKRAPVDELHRLGEDD